MPECNEAVACKVGGDDDAEVNCRVEREERHVAAEKIGQTAEHKCGQNSIGAWLSEQMAYLLKFLLQIQVSFYAVYPSVRPVVRKPENPSEDERQEQQTGNRH